MEFFIDIILRPHFGTGVDSASNRNEYQDYFLGGKGGRCVGLTTLSPSCADCLEIWESQPPGTLWACPGMYSLLYLYMRLGVNGILISILTGGETGGKETTGET